MTHQLVECRMFWCTKVTVLDLAAIDFTFLQLLGGKEIGGSLEIWPQRIIWGDFHLIVDWI